MRHSLVYLSAAFIALAIGLFHPPSLAAQAPDGWVAGHWQGTLVVGSQELQILYHIDAADEGGFSGTMDVPAQGAVGIPLTTVTVDGATLTMTFPLPGGGAYEGTREEASDTIAGTFSQGGQSFPMDLERGEASTPPKPQEPQRPFPYDVDDVTFSNEAAGIELSGTITMPSGEGPFPGVVLISGAGPHDRDGAMLGHKPFLVLADHLTRQGIAVLRYDERGTAASGGDFASATSADLAGDAQAAVALLAAHSNVARVGIAGHSDGGQVAVLTASTSEDADYLVLLAVAAVPGIDLIETQTRLMGEATGVPAPLIALSQRIQARLAAIAVDEPDPEKAAARMQTAGQDILDALSPEDRKRAWNGMGEQVVAQMIQQFNQPQTRITLQYDPRPTLARLTMPVLALYGEKDLQIPPALNAPEMKAALAGNAHASVQTLPDLNHLLQEAQTGGPTEYGQLEQTFSPTALQAIASWINAQTGDLE